MRGESRSTAFGAAQRCALRAQHFPFASTYYPLFAPCRRGLSIIEVMMALAVMGVLLSLAAPSFLRSMEQSRADIAGANLRAIWTAQRVYWLEYHTYTDDLFALAGTGLLDPTIVSATEPYEYEMKSVDSLSFTARATRSGSTKWSGSLKIDEGGNMWGGISASGEPGIHPGFL
jgi:prepilin-type N-terminal cleavage/methylation domain-containing protein